MPVFRLTHDAIEPLPERAFADLNVMERGDLQRLLRANIAVVADDVLVIAEEFAEWDDSRRRIDLLAVDRNANLVVIELKRGETGGHMELQALRYAAMVSSMTFERAAEVFQAFLDEQEPNLEAEQDAAVWLLDFLGWEEPREDAFGRDVRLILVAADFSKELTTSVLWLNERDLDIRCVRLKPYALGSEVVIDAQQVVPLPEAEEYQVRVREKAITRREAARQGTEPTGYWFMNTGDKPTNENRAWEDCKKYAFMTAGGGAKWIDAVRRLRVGDRFFAYLSGHGYVGLGEVVTEAVPQRDFVPPGHTQRLIDLPTTATPRRDQLEDLERCDWCVGVRWLHAVDRDRAVLKNLSRRSTLEQIRQPDTVAKLLQHFVPGGDMETKTPK